MSPPRLAPGVVLDGWRLEERLHQGSMAALWRAQGPDGGPAVLKVPLLREGDDPAALVGFEVEQMILPTLVGRHVPRFLGAGDLATQPYVAMELVPGPSLRDRLEETPLPIEEVVSIGARIATALHELHRQHVIHLDLKPSNVLFRESGDAVLIDFGLSRHDRMPDLLAEQFRLPMGTAPYISPEQVMRIRNEPRSDLFALGAVLYHLVTGVRAFGNPTSIRGLRRRLWRDPVPPRARNPGCPPGLQEVVLRCLETDPARRFDTAAQVAFALQHPDQVPLTERARRTRPDGPWTVLRRWAATQGRQPDPRQSAQAQLSRSPIVVAAVDVQQGPAELVSALREATRRVLDTRAGARLACVTVLRTSRLAMDSTLDDEGRNLRVLRTVQLRDWARPLGLPEGRATFHVLEGPDPAHAIVEFANANAVDHVVLGARASSTLRRYLGSVSSHVVAEADCTVTVVRAPGTAARASPEPSAVTPPE